MTDPSEPTIDTAEQAVDAAIAAARDAIEATVDYYGIVVEISAELRFSPNEQTPKGGFGRTVEVSPSVTIPDTIPAEWTA